MTSYYTEDGRLIFPYEVGAEGNPTRWAIGSRGQRGEDCSIFRFFRGNYESYDSAARALEKYAEKHNLKPAY